MVKIVQKAVTNNRLNSAAARCSSRSEFARTYGSEYNYAWRNGLLDKVCSHMPISPKFSYVRWTDESAAIEAAKYHSRSAFKRGCSGAFCYALDAGILDIVCSRMDKLKNIWEGRDVATEARKYDRRCDFKKYSYSAWKHANKTGIINTVCAHMEINRRSWDKASVIEEAKRYLYRGEFQQGCSAAYKRALAGGYMDEACTHMTDADRGFDFNKPAVVYCIAFTMPNGDQLYKVGITNRTARLRIRGVGTHTWASATILREVPFATGLEARAKEKALHAAMADFRYKGEPIMGNGNTELFSRDATNYL